jgi:hypothetical protein
MLRAAYPMDGRGIHGWLRDPNRPVAALSLWQDLRGRAAMADLNPIRRVRVRPSRAA